MFIPTTALVLSLLATLSTAADVDITREECSGPDCKAHLMTPGLATNTTVNLPASALYLTGVNDVGGAIIDLQKIQCEVKTANPSKVTLLTNQAPAFYDATNVVTVEWILCDYNRATPGK